MGEEQYDYPGNRVDYERLDKLGLMDKEIEPDKALSQKTISRNLQLGNLDGRTFKDVMQLIDLQVSFNSVPHNAGGWLTHDLAEDLLGKKIDQFVVVSNSKGGFLRKNMKMMRMQNINTTQSTKRGFGGRNDE